MGICSATAEMSENPASMASNIAGVAAEMFLRLVGFPAYIPQSSQ